MGNPLPQLPRSPLPQSADLPKLVSNSSGDDEDEDHLEDGPEWYPNDATPLNPLGVTDDFSEPSIDDPDYDPQHVRRSARENRGMHPNRFVVAFVANLESEIKTPTAVEEALNSPKRAQWKAAMAAKMASLQENKVYRLVPRPKGKKVVK